MLRNQRIEPSKSGAAGELRGTISYENLGSIYANNKLGTYGTSRTLPSFCKDSIAVADISEVTGYAEIYCKWTTANATPTRLK